MPYITNTSQEAESMLKQLGKTSFEQLFSQLPSSLRLKDDLSIDQGLSECALWEVLQEIAGRNNTLDQFNSFLGAGIYDHYIPAAVKHLLNRSEFVTSYTPYQPECSQGVLQIIYEYQSYMCLLTGMEVTNASLYDGATALVESLLLSLRSNKKRKVLMAHSINPEYRKTVETYFSDSQFQVESIPFNKQGFIDLDFIRDTVDESTCCVAVQSPNFFGLVEDCQEIAGILKKRNIIYVGITNPLSLAILKEPAALGIDIICGDGQVLGNVMGFGGPTFGFLATNKNFLRQLPGRIVGKTIDHKGETTYCLTLQTREQHIRREKATSNICSNQSLNALGTAIYLSLLGKEGLKQVALYSLNLSHCLFDKFRDIEGVGLPFSDRFFNEFVWQIDDAPGIAQQLRKKKILPGVAIAGEYPTLPNSFLSACTEKKKLSQIDELIESVKREIAKGSKGIN